MKHRSKTLFLILTALALLAGGAPTASAQEGPAETAAAPDCDTDAHRDSGHAPVDLPKIQECMSATADGDTWAECHHADFNCDGVVGIPDFNLFRSAVHQDAS